MALWIDKTKVVERRSRWLADVKDGRYNAVVKYVYACLTQ
jgi:hypothetical protein